MCFCFLSLDPEVSSRCSPCVQSPLRSPPDNEPTTHHTQRQNTATGFLLFYQHLTSQNTSFLSSLQVWTSRDQLVLCCFHSAYYISVSVECSEVERGASLFVRVVYLSASLHQNLHSVLLSLQTGPAQRSQTFFIHRRHTRPCTHNTHFNISALA